MTLPSGLKRELVIWTRGVVTLEPETGRTNLDAALENPRSVFDVHFPPHVPAGNSF